MLNNKLGSIEFESKFVKKADDKEDPNKKKKISELRNKRVNQPTKKQESISCRMSITSGAKDIENNNFNFIHESGLVYDGRLIVDKNFKTTDPYIWAGGSHCEFSRRYKSMCANRMLRMESFNSREIGLQIYKSFGNSLDDE